MKMIKKRLREQARINTETYLKKKKIKRENMEKNRYHIMSEEKKQELKEYQKNYREAKKSLIIINKIVLIVYAVIYAN